jgi:tRNA isopentenyl-2-thiomethyl-A-37 hydroxylase MiaE
VVPEAIRNFLPCSTPAAWIEAALAHPDELLIDHANCEKKAASTAVALLYRYPGRPDGSADLAAPLSRPAGQSVPGPRERVPKDWMTQLQRRRG